MPAPSGGSVMAVHGCACACACTVPSQRFAGGLGVCGRVQKAEHLSWPAEVEDGHFGFI